MNYITNVNADAYFLAQLNTEVWTNASADDKTAALNMGTLAIDRLNYRGCKTDPDQVNQFPRDADTTVPTDIQEATADIALRLLDGVDPELEFENLTMVNQGYANVKSTYDRSTKPRHILNGIVSITAWRKILPFLRDGKTVEIHRVS